MPSLVALLTAARGRNGVPAGDEGPWAEGETQERLGAVYYDTAERDLLAAGLMLRRCTGGEDAGWHLRVPVAAGSRTEVRAALCEGDDESVPGELVDMTFARTGGRALVPVASVDTLRSERRLVDPTGRVLVKLADDTVTAELLSPPDSGAPSTRTAWREIEIEIVDGPRSLLDVIDPILREHGLRPSRSSSKLARALGETTPGSTADDGPDAKKPPRLQRKKASAADVALAHIGVQVEQIRSQDLPVRLDTPGAVHAMRVASRRLRSALTTFEPLFHDSEIRPVRTELKWLAGVLGAARDAEVMRERVTVAVDREGPDGWLRPTVPAEVGGELDEAWRTAHDEVIAQLCTERYRSLLLALGHLVDHPPLKDRAHRRAADVLPRLVLRSYRDVRSAMAAADGPAHVDRETRLHDARKAAKRARYAAEAVAPVFGKDARAFATAMEGLQETLGEHLDSLNTRARLRSLATDTPLPSAAFTYGRLHALEDVQAARSRADVDAAWARARRRRLRRWLG